MLSEQHLQELVYRFEEGPWAKVVRNVFLFVVALFLFVLFIFDPYYWGFYKGLRNPRAMEQAQIARELMRGNGFSTKMIRPIALSQIQGHTGQLPTGNVPDAFHAPLWPTILAGVLYTVDQWPESLSTGKSTKKERLKMTLRDFIYIGDRAISATATLFLLLSIPVNYLLARRLFDRHIALWTVCLMIGCRQLWSYGLSGLPQMFMLLLFSCTLYCLVRAMDLFEEKNLWPGFWLLFISILVSLMTLAHGFGFWFFLGLLAFCCIQFTPRWQTVALMVGVFLLFNTPWLVRNYQVCGNIFGTSIYSILEALRGSEINIMRSEELEYANVSPMVFRLKIQNQFMGQLANIFYSFGSVLVAPVFFLSLLHLFRKKTPRNFRWALMLIWGSVLFGMCAFGIVEEDYALASTNMNILFLPAFCMYGIAFLLVLWSRLEIRILFLKYAFYTIVFCLSTMPMISLLTQRGYPSLQWPPYAPPYITLLGDWTEPNEIITSDMPWAVGWYADRKSLWLPNTIQKFLEYTDYKRLGGPMAGIYLTPLTGNQPLISGIVKGDYKEWTNFILRNVNIKDFPMHSVVALPMENQCIFYSDRNRWNPNTD